MISLRFIVKAIRDLNSPKKFFIHRPRLLRATWGRFGKRIERYCPLCKKGFGTRFWPYGESTVDDTLCPTCSSTERIRLLWLYLEERLKLCEQAISILHFAPEFSLERILEKRYGEDYITVGIKPGRAKQVADITDLPFIDNSFDYIICSHVLEHVVDDMKALNEMYRVLKHDGEAMIMIPLKGERTFEDPDITRPEDRLTHFGQSDHVRFYGANVLQRIETAGFSVSRIESNDIVANESLRITMGITTKSDNAPATIFVGKKL